MDGVLLLHQAQLCGTASPNTSETQHYPLIRLGAILKETFLLDINIHTTFLRSRNYLTACAIQVFFIVIVIAQVHCNTSAIVIVD